MSIRTSSDRKQDRMTSTGLIPLSCKKRRFVSIKMTSQNTKKRSSSTSHKGTKGKGATKAKAVTIIKVKRRTKTQHKDTDNFRSGEPG
jgi:hypothetical protein